MLWLRVAPASDGNIECFCRERTLSAFRSGNELVERFGKSVAN